MTSGSRILLILASSVLLSACASTTGLAPTGVARTQPIPLRGHALDATVAAALDPLSAPAGPVVDRAEPTDLVEPEQPGLFAIRSARRHETDGVISHGYVTDERRFTEPGAGGAGVELVLSRQITLSVGGAMDGEQSAFSGVLMLGSRW